MCNETRESVTPAKIRSGCFPKSVTCHCIVLLRAELRRQPSILGRLDKASRSTKLQLFSPVTSDILLSCSIFLRAKITSLSIAPPSPFGLKAASRPLSLSLSLSLSLLFPRLIYFFIMIPFGLRPCLFLSPMLHISAISSPKFGLSSGLSSTTPQKKKGAKKIWPKDSGASIEYVFSLCKSRNDFAFP